MASPDIYLVCLAVLPLIDPDVRITKDPALAKPIEYSANALYLYPLDEEHSGYESGYGVRQDFRLYLDLVLDDQGEAAGLGRLPAVTTALRAKAAAYGDWVRLNQRTLDYDHLRVAAIDWQALNGIGYRGFRMRLEGYRLID